MAHRGSFFFGIGEFTTHFRTYFCGDWDVLWGYDLGFDPWPHRSSVHLRAFRSQSHTNGGIYRVLRVFFVKFILAVGGT